MAVPIITHAVQLRRLTQLGGFCGQLSFIARVVSKHTKISVHALSDPRHSFASRALALGESLPMIGKLLGHRQIRRTARYARLARDSMKAAAARIADSLEADMGTPPDASLSA